MTAIPYVIRKQSSLAIGSTITSATQGSVLFVGASGVLAQDNSNLFWDDSANKFTVSLVGVSGNSAASVPAESLTGNWFTGGSATTTKPHFLIEPTGATSTGWGTSGTGLGVNAASGFAGNLVDLQLNGTRVASATWSGVVKLNPSSSDIGEIATNGALQIYPNAFVGTEHVKLGRITYSGVNSCIIETAFGSTHCYIWADASSSNVGIGNNRHPEAAGNTAGADLVLDTASARFRIGTGAAEYTPLTVSSATQATLTSCPTSSVIGAAVRGVASQSAVLLQLQGRSSTTDGREQADFDTAWADSTDATRKARFVLRAWDTAAREVMRGEASGTAPMVGFLGANAVVRPTALTTQLTTVTHTAPTPDYAIQDLVNVAPFGFVTKDEGNTVLSVIANLQARVAELETKLQALGLLT
jgi:hypothetical protein